MRRKHVTCYNDAGIRGVGNNFCLLICKSCDGGLGSCSPWWWDFWWLNSHWLTSHSGFQKRSWSLGMYNCFRVFPSLKNLQLMKRVSFAWRGKFDYNSPISVTIKFLVTVSSMGFENRVLSEINTCLLPYIHNSSSKKGKSIRKSWRVLYLTRFSYWRAHILGKFLYRYFTL